jgi:hypothetical protein
VRTILRSDWKKTEHILLSGHFYSRLYIILLQVMPINHPSERHSYLRPTYLNGVGNDDGEMEGSIGLYLRLQFVVAVGCGL